MVSPKISSSKPRRPRVQASLQIQTLQLWVARQDNKKVEVRSQVDLRETSSSNRTKDSRTAMPTSVVSAKNKAN